MGNVHRPTVGRIGLKYLQSFDLIRTATIRFSTANTKDKYLGSLATPILMTSA